jgi:hypothetical protein
MANGHGGQRPGAGRKPNVEKYSDQIAKASDRLAEALPDFVESLIDLTLGKATGETWAAAGTVTRKDVARDADGKPVVGEKGKLYIVDVPVFPDKPPEELVLVEKTPGPPDIKAIMYAWDRLEGRPNYVAPPDPEALSLREALEKVKARIAAYVDPDETPAVPEEKGAEVDG